MEESHMDTFSVLNYQGSKKNILDFIHQNTERLLDDNSTILDIFSGTSSVGYSFKSKYRVFANDCEKYAFVIAKSLLSSNYDDFSNIKDEFLYYYENNIMKQRASYKDFAKEEQYLISKNSVDELIKLYTIIPTVWNNGESIFLTHNSYELFTTYYSTSYFGVNQAMQIDSIRFAISKYWGKSLYYPMLTSLYYSMKECVFSKDGHMAQPLDPSKNKERLLKQRRKSILDVFLTKIKEFSSDLFTNSNKENLVFNLNFSDLLKQKDIREKVSFIYADPPYTDMQYSRYYHLLNTVTDYCYPELTRKNGLYTKGLYVNNRYQSKLSKKSQCIDSFTELLQFCKEYKKDLAISFAFPVDLSSQKSDRYVMNIEDLIKSCNSLFGITNIEVVTQNYQHSNNRNSTPKKVNEYLILCKGK